MAGPIRISILADDRASRVFTSVGATAGGMSARVGRAGKLMGAAVVASSVLAGAAVVKFGTDSVKAASAAQQSLGATETVFGKYADSVIKRSNQAATAVGLSANEYRELANVVGASLTGAGVSTARAAVLTDDLNRRASDMAATFGGTTREAIEAVSSALRGETDPIERYGVSIKQTDVNARLAAQGQDKLTGAALKAAEMQARLDLVFEKTAKTQGAFARESDTLAHQQQVLGAQWENLKATVGTALLPVLTQFLTFLNANLMPAFAAVSAAVGPVIDRIQAFGDGASSGQGKLAALSAFMREQVVPAVAGVVLAYQGLLDVVLPIIHQIADAVIVGWGQIQPQVASIWGSVQSIILNALAILQRVVQLGTAAISKIWSLFGNDILKFITATMGNVATFLKGAFQILEGLFQAVSSALRGDWKGAWDGIKKILEGALNVIRGALGQGLDMIRFAFSAALTALKAVAEKIWDGIVAVFRTQVGLALDVVRSIKGKITGFFAGARDWLLQAGKDILAGLADGIDAARQWVMDKINAIADSIPGWLKKRLGIESPSKVMRRLAKWIPAGIAKGIDDGEAGVRAALDKLNELIRKRVDLKDDQREKAREREILQALRDQQREWIKNAKLQDRANAALDRARDRLKQLKNAAADYARQIKDAVIASGNIADVGASDDQPTTEWSIVAGVNGALQRAQMFAGYIRTLRERGLNETSLKQLLDKGVEGGFEAAQALARGSADAITMINQITADLIKTGKDLGVETSDAFYSNGIRAAEAVVTGLEARADRFAKIGVALADRFLTRVEKMLARQAAAQGKNPGKDRQSTAEKAAAANTARAAEQQAAARAAAAQPVEVKINVTAPVGASSADIGRELQSHLTAYFTSGGRRLAIG